MKPSLRGHLVGTAMLVALLGCASNSALRAPAEFKVVQNRIFEGVSANEVLSNLKSFLEAEGHFLKVYDPRSLLLTAKLKRVQGPKLVLWKNWQFYLRDSRVIELELHATVLTPERGKAELRLSLQKLQRGRLKGVHGSEVLDDPPYRSLFKYLTQKMQGAFSSGDEESEETTDSPAQAAQGET